MKKSTLKKLAAIGLMSGLAVACHNEQTTKQTTPPNNTNTPTDTRDLNQQNAPLKNNSSMNTKQETIKQVNNKQGAKNIIPVANAEMSEEELLKNLNEKGKALYYTLDDEGKGLARRLAAQTCSGHNECKGLNSCKNGSHECAGLGSCKGTSTCGFADKNTAVKIAVKHMAEKRAKTSY